QTVQSIGHFRYAPARAADAQYRYRVAGNVQWTGLFEPLHSHHIAWLDQWEPVLQRRARVDDAPETARDVQRWIIQLVRLRHGRARGSPRVVGNPVASIGVRTSG